MKNKKNLLAALAITLVLGLTVGCGDGGGGGSGAGADAGAGSGTTPAFPVVFKDGKFMKGVSVVQGDYSTYEDKTKGNVTVTNTGIVVKPAEGKDQYDGDNVTGHYTLNFKLANVLDLTGYKGIRFVSDQSGGGGFVVRLTDNTGKTVCTADDGGQWDAVDLAFWVGTPEDGSSTTGEGLFTENMGGKDDPDGNWALDISDFTYKIKGINFDFGVADIPYAELPSGTLTSIEFFK
jgi:hypothetical protein